MPIPITLILVVLFSSGVGLLFVFALRFVWRSTVTADFKDLASPMATRLGAVHALILALAFNTAMGEYVELQEAIDEEAVLIVQMLYNLERKVNAETARPILQELETYVQAVVRDDWMAKDPYTRKRTADKSFAQLRAHIDSLQKPYRDIASKLDASMDAIEQRRFQRLLDLQQGAPSLFWFLSITLFFVALLPFSHHKLTPRSGLLIASYGMATGLILYSIFVFSSPFQSVPPISNDSLRAAQWSIEQSMEATE